MCFNNAANVKKLAASVQTDDSSISSLQEDERNKLRVSMAIYIHVDCVHVIYTMFDLHDMFAGLYRRLKHLRLPLMNCERRG